MYKEKVTLDLSPIVHERDRVIATRVGTQVLSLTEFVPAFYEKTAIDTGDNYHISFQWEGEWPDLSVKTINEKLLSIAGVKDIKLNERSISVIIQKTPHYESTPVNYDPSLNGPFSATGFSNNNNDGPNIGQLGSAIKVIRDIKGNISLKYAPRDENDKIIESVITEKFEGVSGIQRATVIKEIKVLLADRQKASSTGARKFVVRRQHLTSVNPEAFPSSRR